MKKSFVFLCIFSIFLSCGDDPMVEISDPELMECRLEVSVVKCPISPCNELIPLENIKVELYPSIEEAIEGTNRINIQFSNPNGRSVFTSELCEKIFIKAVSPNNGTYISSTITLERDTDNFHEIRFISNYTYDNSDELYAQSHISLERPVTGQISRYKGYVNPLHNSFTPLEYLEDIFLEVELVTQLSHNSFVVEERADSLVFGPYMWTDENIHRTIWTFENNGCKVTRYEDQEYVSYVWNIRNTFGLEDEYFFPFEAEVENRIDMTTDEVSPPNSEWWSNGYAEDYLLFDHLYTDILVERESQQAIDGPLVYRVYDKKDGIIRSMHFFPISIYTTRGFDLVLE